MASDEKKDLWQELRDVARRRAIQFEAEWGDGVERAGAVAREVASSVRLEVTRLDEEYRLGEQVREVAEEVGARAQAGRQQVEEKAREVLGSAQAYYESTEQAMATSARWVAAGAAVTDGLARARSWIRENPGKMTVLSLSMLAGARAGAALPTLGISVLGVGGAGHWLFQSAVPVLGLRFLAREFEERLRKQQELLKQGNLEEVERERIEMERDLLRYVGAPLLGTFSIAAGASLIGAAIGGTTATGLPVSLLLGPTPLLNAIWFFANGVVCIREGYQFFLIALADEEEVARLVREVSGLLPPASAV
jgi:hypothetical protein